MLDGQLDAHPVRILDVSFGGVGGAIEILGSLDYKPETEVDLPLVIEGRNGAVEAFTVQVLRLDDKAGTFGARFVNMTDHQFRVLEKLTTARQF